MSAIDKLLTHAHRASLDPGALLAAHRTILVRGMIDDQVANEVIAKMLFLQHERSGPFAIYIDSPGGFVSSSLAIRDAIDEMRELVSTHCLGVASGTALLLLAHGAVGSRTAAPGARFVLTPVEARDREDLAPAEYERIERLVIGFLADDSCQPPDLVARDVAAGRTFDADQARAYGFIDRVEG